MLIIFYRFKSQEDSTLCLCCGEQPEDYYMMFSKIKSPILLIHKKINDDKGYKEAETLKNFALTEGKTIQLVPNLVEKNNSTFL